ncbi:MAG: VWA domain-containing protein, partial [Deltaproteobacteria bacterium]|nr:VWA domain-containing protein [Deltaproteobacteria bacterium]
RLCPADAVLAHPLFGLFSERAPTEDAGAPSRPEALPRGTELRMRRRDRASLKQLGDEQQESPLVHSFEKLHTLEEHTGGRKRADGSDELEAHAEALDELEITEVIRSDEAAESLLRSDAMFESGAGEVADAPEAVGIPYDEWDQRAGRFRPDHCMVHVGPLEERVPLLLAQRSAEQAVAALRQPIESTRAALLALEQAARPRLRELDGPDVDDDAMVSRHAALAAGATPPDRLYASRRRHRPELAVLLLLDASLSTDGWIEGRRVLDVEREAALVVGEAVEGLVDELAIAAFSSRTRRDCRFDVLKGLSEPWARSRHRLFSVEPAGYTRIGPALRHGRAVLERARAARKAVLLVTDGKPNDYDRYEGSYGLDDVGHAVLEASAAGIHVHGLAIDLSARANLPRMFGLGRFTLVRSPDVLPTAMGALIARLGR